MKYKDETQEIKRREMSIPFTQFMMPDGHQKQVSIERPAEISAKASSLIEAGVRFEIEMLSTGQISMEAYHPGKDIVLAAEIVRNGPGVPNAVDRLVVVASENYEHQPKY